MRYVICQASLLFIIGIGMTDLTGPTAGQRI